MTTHLKTRDLARCLLAYEAAEDNTSEPSESVTLRVYEKLRQGLCEFAGVAGFQSLASRALVLARTEAPSLIAVRVATDGTLHGLGEFEHQMHVDNNRAGESPAGEGGFILIACLLSMLLIMLGEGATQSLLRAMWPEAALNNYNSANGRSA